MMPFTIKIQKALYYVLNVLITLIEFFLGLRVILKLLAANPSPFVNWIYNVSDAFLGPFQGMFNNYVTTDGRVLEFSVLFAMAFYALMYFFFVQLLNLVADVVEKNNNPQSPNKKKNTPETTGSGDQSAQES